MHFRKVFLVRLSGRYFLGQGVLFKLKEQVDRVQGPTHFLLTHDVVACKLEKVRVVERGPVLGGKEEGVELFLRVDLPKEFE